MGPAGLFPLALGWRPRKPGLGPAPCSSAPPRAAPAAAFGRVFVRNELGHHLSYLVLDSPSQRQSSQALETLFQDRGSPSVSLHVVQRRIIAVQFAHCTKAPAEVTRAQNPATCQTTRLRATSAQRGHLLLTSQRLWPGKCLVPKAHAVP